MADRKPALEPSIIVIFGITGDLSQRYLMPALYHLIKDGLLHEKTEIVGISRREVSTKELFDNVELCVNEVDKACDPEALKKMQQQTRMLQMDVTEQADYAKLLQQLNAIEEEQGLCMNRLYYLSIPPQVYGPIIKLMGKEGLNTSCKHNKAMTRLLVEKPFGYNLQSAQELIEETSKVFSEEQVFRIDHYLAKETVQNILTFRFENPIFESLWNRDHIASIEISASEQIGIEGRANFYEPLGALRDLIQSHLIQVLGVVTMDRPDEMDSDHIHTQKQRVMAQIKPVPADHVAELTIRAQYEGYREEVKNTDSTTETFAAVKLFIDGERWQGIPMTIWTGKALNEKKTEIVVTFKTDHGEPANQLRFRIQPNEGIELDLLAKKPGFETDLQPVTMDFSYQQNFASHDHPNAYERVLVDAVRGDHTLFATGEEVLHSWRIVQPVISEWAKSADDLTTYKKGIAGNNLLQ